MLALVDTSVNVPQTRSSLEVLVLDVFLVNGRSWILRASDNLLNVLGVLLRLHKIELLETFMELVDVRHWLAYDCFSVIFAKLVRQILFLG